ncbi:hypothetical protein CTEN210_17549 [Chaetoceros tenuissimus]|uniref:Uncharacterized protein n=1 Tax=Chaetoceros tenuissimus TaxID=426638 RepID=A0AAD3DAY6_9STRA|nr:hypothetical protein CTEN210_17549 [Chaetoceros tenuissimus]
MGNYLTTKSEPAPLLQPAIEGNLAKIKELVGHHIAATSLKSNDELANFVNDADEEGNSALIGAAFSGHLDICKFLIEDCHADVLQKNKIGCSPLWIACGYGHVDIVEYLVTYMNDSRNNLNVSAAFLEGNSTGDLPLLAAAFKGHVKVIEKALEILNDADVWDILISKNNSGDTLLHVVVSSGYEGPLLELLLESEQRLFDSNDFNERPLTMKNKAGLTPLLVACERNFVNIVKELIQRGADLQTSDENERRPLAIASFCGCMDVMEYLLTLDESKKAIDATEKNGCTALWLAARTGNDKMVKVLIDAGADASIRNNEGMTPQDTAEKYKKEKVVEYFAQSFSN